MTIALDKVALADANYEHALRCLALAAPGGQHREVHGVSVSLTGASKAAFNVALVINELDDPARALGEAMDLATASEVPLGIAVRRDLVPAIAPVVAALGYRREAALPAMAVDIAPDIGPPDELDVTRVETLEEYAVWSRVNADAFEMDRSVVDQVFGPGLLGIDGYESYLAWAGDEPVATASVVFDANGTAGIYNVATLAALRRRGLGGGLTRYGLARAAALGARLCCLQAYESGRGIYEALGFREVCVYDCYGPG